MKKTDYVFIIMVIVVMIIGFVWTYYQYQNCMGKFDDWFYCFQHAT